jgi:hypothetical protein
MSELERLRKVILDAWTYVKDEKYEKTFRILEREIIEGMKGKEYEERL